MRLTAVPIAWSRGDGQGEPICYSVEGLPAGERAMISAAPRGWRLVIERLSDAEQQVLYAGPEEAVDALISMIETEAEKPPAY